MKSLANYRLSYLHLDRLTDFSYCQFHHKKYILSMIRCFISLIEEINLDKIQVINMLIIEGHGLMDPNACKNYKFCLE